MFEHILVPLDGSIRAEAALPIAARIAHAAGSSVALLQVVSISMGYDGYGSDLGMSAGYGGGGLGAGVVYGGGTIGMGNNLGVIPHIAEKASETEHTEATTYLTRLVTSDQFAGIAPTTNVVFGRPAPEILALMDQQAIDLIILCNHGRTGFLRWVLGSVAQRVIHHSPVPVLVLHEEGATTPALHADATHPFCVTVALDGSLLAETALLPAAHLAAALAQPTQGVVHLLSVVKPSMFTTNSDILSQHDTEAMERVQAYLQNVRERLLMETSDLHLQVTWSVTPAQDVAETIVTGAEGTGENKSDVIAIATHGHGSIERWVMGSVTERVIGAATVPVLVVRPPHDVLLTEKS
jgi:nucleotide-binding universal stress UspA family protein